MKKPKYLDIVLLLGFLLLLSAGVSLLAKTENSHLVPTESDKTVLNQISPLLMARNVKKIAEFISHLQQPQQLRIMNQLLDDQKNPLEVTDKIRLLLELALKTENQDHRIALYNALIENEQVAKQKPLLFIAAEGNYEDLLGSIADWLSQHKDVFSDWFYKGVLEAIKENKPEIANKLLSRFLTIPPDLATKLLWEVIKGKKSAEFIAPLVKKGANVNDALQGRTLLIAAVELDQESLVGALLKNGAEKTINTFVDPAVGTALQVAIQNQKKTKDSRIEELLRSKGAHE